LLIAPEIEILRLSAGEGEYHSKTNAEGKDLAS